MPLGYQHLQTFHYKVPIHGMTWSATLGHVEFHLTPSFDSHEVAMLSHFRQIGLSLAMFRRPGRILPDNWVSVKVYFGGNFRDKLYSFSARKLRTCNKFETRFPHKISKVFIWNLFFVERDNRWKLLYERESICQAGFLANLVLLLLSVWDLNSNYSFKEIDLTSSQAEHLGFKFSAWWRPQYSRPSFQK